MRKILALVVVCLQGACAQLHHVQLADIDAPGSSNKIDIKLSETGVDIREAQAILRRLGNDRFKKNVDGVGDIVRLFQTGPRTGSPVYSKDYARPLLDLLWEKCPSGHISNLVAIRETRKYPVISGEIVRLRGDCHK